ncbi:MAG TPA: PAS domain S-box protein [Bryobacteraceae bacterium]|nr:PAS domain S-box protein [Bryobacteraceae bacterium]
MPRETIRVLLLEDDPEDYEIALACLGAVAERNYEIDWEQSFEAALEALQRATWDVCLVDLCLNGRDGFEFIWEASALRPDVPMILMTGHGGPEVENGALAAGATDYVCKNGLTGPLLDRVIRYAMERSRRMISLRESKQFLRSALDALSNHLAILDENGVIISVNQAWTTLFRSSDFPGSHLGTGANYLAACDEGASQGNSAARELAQAIRDVIARRWNLFYLEYAAYGSREWFSVRVTRFEEGQSVRAVISHTNITERRKAELAVSLNETRFRALIEHSSDATILTDADGGVCYTSPAAERLFGCAAGEIAGRRMVEFLHPDDRDRTIETVSQILANPGASVRLQCRVFSKDRAWRSVNGTATNLLGDPGVAAVVLNWRDETEQYLAEQELSRSEARFRQLAESGLIGVVEFDLYGCILSANSAFLEMVGASADQLARGELHLRQLTAPDHVERFERKLVNLRFADSVRPFEKDYIRLDGSRVPALVGAARVAGADDRVIAFTVSLADRARAERRYSDLFENANDIVFTLDLEGRLTSVNRAGEKVCGKSRDALLGRKLEEVMSAQQCGSLGELMRSALNCEARGIREVIVTSPDGEPLDLEVNAQLIRESGTPVGLQCIARDVTDRRHLENQLRHAQKMEAIGSLAGGIAHDFNNLLTVILSSVSFARMVTPPGHPGSAELNRINDAASRAADLTRHLLTFSRQQVLQPAPVHLNTMIQASAAILRPLLGEHIELTTSLAPELPLVSLDPGQVEQVFLNLAVNARDAMPDGGALSISTAVLEHVPEFRHPDLSPGRYVALTVRDTGCGMDAETLARIFEPFFTTKEIGRGTGLGLSTVYGIVKQSGGSIWATSEPENGTEFEILFPALDGNAPETGTETDANRSHADRPGSETILLVEDDALLLSLLADSLSLNGYRVITATCGEDALGALSGAEIDLLITDVVMPRMNGYDLREKCAAIRPGIRTLYISGYASDMKVVGRAIQNGHPFIHKPFTPAVFTRKVREVLDGEAWDREASLCVAAGLVRE